VPVRFQLRTTCPAVGSIVGAYDLPARKEAAVQLNWLAIAVATILVFVFSAVYYTSLAERGRALGAPWAQRSGRPGLMFIVVQLLRALVVTVVVAGLVSLIGITDVVGAVELALALWIAFPVTLLVASVMTENVPPGLAAIHSGDWLAKLLIISVLVALWR
jgi:uncharacterized protein DUF1761